MFAAIDWRRGYESLNRELRQIVRAARLGRGVADCLFKVWLEDGVEAWLLIHVEVQGSRRPDFPERMFVYGYRIYDRYRRGVVSIAVLSDDQPSWRPDHFESSALGSAIGIRFLVAKLLDHREQQAELERSANPFAAVVLAHLKTLETRQTPAERRSWKLRLIKGLYQRGLSADQVRQLFALIDWMMTLPAELEQSFRAELDSFEEEQRMPYVTSVERLAKEEGRLEGRQEGMVEGLQEAVNLSLDSRFGAAGKRLWRKVRELRDVERLRNLSRALSEGKSLQSIRQLFS